MVVRKRKSIRPSIYQCTKATQLNVKGLLVTSTRSKTYIHSVNLQKKTVHGKVLQTGQNFNLKDKKRITKYPKIYETFLKKQSIYTTFNEKR